MLKRKPARAEEPCINEPKHFYINEEIKASSVRLVEGNSHSIISLEDALKRARGVGKDVMQVALHGDLPVCKIMDSALYLEERQRMLEERHAAAQREISEKESRQKSIRIGCALRCLHFKCACRPGLAHVIKSVGSSFAMSNNPKSLQAWAAQPIGQGTLI
jgi:hypothetical protein